VNIDLFLLIIVVITALAFDFTNGFHDTGNAMATSIASGALKPKTAVLLSAVLNLVGAFLSTAVAATIAKGLIDSNLVTLELVFAGLVGGIVWNLLTWLLGIPSSSSHALIGGIVGATIAAVGGHGVIWKGVVSKVLIPAISTGSPTGSRKSAPQPGSGTARSVRRRWSRWRTAPTTRRKRWA
jgi:inorganic phosphate transporter, PiT family